MRSGALINTVPSTHTDIQSSPLDSITMVILPILLWSVLALSMASPTDIQDKWLVSAFEGTQRGGDMKGESVQKVQTVERNTPQEGKKQTESAFANGGMENVRENAPGEGKHEGETHSEDYNVKAATNSERAGESDKTGVASKVKPTTKGGQAGKSEKPDDGFVDYRKNVKEVVDYDEKVKEVPSKTVPTDGPRSQGKTATLNTQTLPAVTDTNANKKRGNQQNIQTGTVNNPSDNGNGGPSEATIMTETPGYPYNNEDNKYMKSGQGTAGQSVFINKVSLMYHQGSGQCPPCHYAEG